MTAGATSLGRVDASETQAQRCHLVDRTLKRVGLAHVLGVAIGVTDLFLLAWFVLPEPDLGSGSPRAVLISNLVAVAVVTPLLVALGVWWAYRVARPIQRFMREERAPTDSERIATLKQPIKGAKISAAGWAAGAVLIGALNLRFSVDLAFHVASTVLMGGITTIAVTYLLTDRIMRTLTARALADAPPPKLCAPGVQGRLLLAWLLATGVPLLGLGFVGGHALIEQVPPERLATSVLVLSVAAATSGLIATLLVARSVGEPLMALRRAVGQIEEGDLDTAVPVDDGSEVGLLQSGFNQMAAGLREREHLRDLFGRHVGAEVARDALERPPELGGEQREVAVLFVDLVGSTELATRWSATDVVSLLNRFFTIVVDTVDGHGGWVNKFEGDAALCVFGAPLPDDGCASGALAAGRELRDRLSRELPRADVGIGVSAGLAVAGNVGAEHRFEYTVIGDPVNEAARLCELAKGRDGRLVASDAVLERADADEAARWELSESLVLRGRSEATRLAIPRAGGSHAAREPAPAATAVS